MKFLLSLVLFVAAGLCVVASGPGIPQGTAVNVTQHHNNLSRDGLYIDPTFTVAAAANLARDLAFDGTIVGNVYSQPLYIEGGASGPMVIVATESNNVYALNATTGAIIWQRNAGTPSTGMGNISPLGITGTPVVDLASRSLFFDAVVSGPNNLIFSLNVDTGAINAGWPVNVNNAILGFSSQRQSQRAALTVLGSSVYVPYGGYFGDAPTYFGRVVGVQMDSPASVTSWATTATKSGIWGPGGIASDGTNLFVTTGNAPGGSGWGAQESIVRLQAGPIFTGATTDFWTPTNYTALDSGDTDLGGSGPILVDVPGATPSALVLALGKDGNAYLVNRNNLGGISAPVSQLSVGGMIIQAAATYRTALGAYVVYRQSSTVTKAFKITAANPPAIITGWTVGGANGRSSPFVTSTDGTNNVIVWVVGSGGDNRLHGYDGDTGAVVYAGGGANDLMTGSRGYNANGIAARGRIYVANDNKVFAFNVPSGISTPTPTPTATAMPTATATATSHSYCHSDCDCNRDRHPDNHPVTYTNRNSHLHSNRYRNPYCNSDVDTDSYPRFSDTHGYRNGYSHRNCHLDTDSYPRFFSHTYGDCHCYSNRHRHCHADARFANAYGYGYCGCHSNGDRYRYSNSYSYGHGCSYRDGYCHRLTDSYGHIYSHRYGGYDGHSDRDGSSYCYCNGHSGAYRCGHGNRDDNADSDCDGGT